MFDLKKFAGARHSGTIEKGEYPAIIDKMEWAESTAGEMMLVATISILIAHGKKIIRDYFNLFNRNSMAAEISASRLADMTGACGLSEPPSDARVFEGMRLSVRVGVDNKGYNIIDKYVYWKPNDNAGVKNANLTRLCVETISSDCNSIPQISNAEDDYEYLETIVPEEF